MNPTDFLSGPVAEALGWTLLHALWQGFALVLPTAVLLYLLRNRSSELRYRVGVLALLAQVLLSAATFAWYYEAAAVAGPVSADAALVRSVPLRWQAITQTLPWHLQVRQFLQRHLGQFVLIYLIGVALFGLRLAGGWLYLHRLSRSATQPGTQMLTQLTNTLRSALAIRAVVRVRESARIAVPMVVGTLKPVLLLPLGLATNLSMREVEAVLAHELAHIKRHDYAVNLLQSAMEVLYFFHPALWWLSARVREEREHCCDDLAVRAIGGDGRILAQALAHVEELRLAQINLANQPALAMALATKRQQLLHRVRRMLGVPTRSFVSNSSLAGLTLATLLLVSVSVYAVQQDMQQPKPKPRTTQPQPTRRHKVDSRSEYGMAGNKTISYVIWKGQKLPTSRVTRLQKQLDQVMTGQLNLDTVKQPDRDILLTIIEKNNAFDSGMNGLAEGLAHIDYDNIVSTALNTIPDSPDGMLAGLEKINYDSVVNDALATVTSFQPLTDSLKRMAAQRKLDSLMTQIKTVMNGRKEAIDQISKEMADLTLKSTDFQRQHLLQGQAGLIGQQARLAAEIARLSLRNDAKSEALLRQNEQKLARLEKELQSRTKQVEKQVEQQQRQMLPSSAYTDRLSALGDSMSRLMEPVTAISQQIGELSGQIAEDAMRQAEEARQLVDAINVHVDVPAVLRAPKAPRAPRTLRGTVKPVPPAAPVPPTNVPVRPKPAPRPVPSVAPVSSPKPTKSNE